MDPTPVSRPVAVFRRRKRTLRRRMWEAAGGTVLALMVWPLPTMFAWEAWVTLGLTSAAGLGFAYYLYRTYRHARDTITLYPDRFTWHDRLGRFHEATYDRIVDIEPDRNRHRHLVRVSGHGGFWISPEIERFTELWRRLHGPGQMRGGLPFGREAWSGRRRFRPQRATLYRGIALFLLSFLFLNGTLQQFVLHLGILGFLTSFAGFHQVFSYLYERIEIEGDEIVHRSWFIGRPRRIPVGSVVGGCLYDSRSRRTGVIDTENGEIRFGYGFVGERALIEEAERLGAARLALAPSLPAPGDRK